VSGDIAPDVLFASTLDPERKSADVENWLAHDKVETHGDAASHRHRADVHSFCIVRDEPVHAVTLALFLSALAENCGDDLLRMKGLVNVAEQPQFPAVVHGVQHVYHAPVWLQRWPSEDRRTRMVFIGRHIREVWVRGLLDLLDSEVSDEIARRSI